MQAREVSVEQAIDDAPDASKRLCSLAAQHRQNHREVNCHDTRRHWQASAGTYCYQTHIAIEGQPHTRLDWLAGVFYNHASLPAHAWYPQFLGGKVQALAAPPATGIEQHQLAWGRFDLGLPTPRYYRQLLSLAQPQDNTWVIVARSVTTGPELPQAAKLAYTPDPNGEVLHFENGRLHWHHICCAPGAGMLPGRLDRWLINAMRRTGLDGAERKTYRDEALKLRDWLDTQPVELPG
ncbi:hypothetical protein BST95_01880 [Halioglobus japonicus]|uniref:Uncharacterized protein n=1 Tax=Halioglobus japonicus TaxID=930805 RepID=A0AAP8SM15_9GAMM|nr:hypothetical protein [Halioglobus japonicus]AQA17151.1 hypothetical protein BST95_01880 [Halioglobus japonicus]PLW85064.1 hypothetical protein C0029_16150 [Halioglobus japonicus]GHD19275.1 hypothetical protein GCM10007052_27530 [Halioglobus japonicus]